MSDRGFRHAPAAVLFLVLPFLAGADAGSGTSGVPRQSLNPPLQDLDEIEGEIVWVQGALLRGDPRPYQSILEPLATPEQGLLDDEGELWTFLDNPKGRELRYNPQLRGQRVIVKGWKHPKSKIFEVFSWEDSEGHPVRAREDYPEPERIPFEPEKADRIESIPPVAPAEIDVEKLNTDLWKIREGKNLIPSDNDRGKVQPPSVTGDAEEIRRLLQESPVPRSETDAGETQKPAADSPAPAAKEPSAEPPGASTVESASSSRRTGASPRAKEVAPPQPRVLNEFGQPVASPEEIDRALLKSLTE